MDQYNHRDPLTFWSGRVQVKDLPPEERDAFVRNYHEEQDQIKKHLPEFRFVSRKRAKFINEMTELEQKQWMTFLQRENAEVLEHIQGNDFFTLDNDDYYEGYNDELYIDTWEWSVSNLYQQVVITLTDIYGWPGDNQHGAVFIGEVPVFTNSDTRLTVIEGTPYTPILREREKSLSHLKHDLFSNERCIDHEHSCVAGASTKLCREQNTFLTTFNELMNRETDDGSYNILGDFDIADFPETQDELESPLKPETHDLKLYYYIDRYMILPPIGVQYNIDRAITPKDILESINAFYHQPLSQENVQYYISMDSDYKHLLVWSQPMLKEVIGDHELEGLTTYKDGYLVSIL